MGCPARTDSRLGRLLHKGSEQRRLAMRVVNTVLALAVSLMIVGNLSAAEEKTRPESKHPRHPGMERPMMERWDMFPEDMLKGLNLTDDQKAKLGELKKEYGPKFKEEATKRESLLTDEQKKAREEAVKAAKAAGEKTRDSWKDVKNAVKLTDEQKTKMAELRKETEVLHKEVREKITALLTPEQKAQLKEKREQRREHKPEGSK